MCYVTERSAGGLRAALIVITKRTRPHALREPISSVQPEHAVYCALSTGVRIMEVVAPVQVVLVGHAGCLQGPVLRTRRVLLSGPTAAAAI